MLTKEISKYLTPKDLEMISYKGSDNYSQMGTYRPQSMNKQLRKGLSESQNNFASLDKKICRVCIQKFRMQNEIKSVNDFSKIQCPHYQQENSNNQKSKNQFSAQNYTNHHPKTLIQSKNNYINHQKSLNSFDELNLTSSSKFSNKRKITKLRGQSQMDHLSNEIFKKEYNPLISTYENDLNEGISIKQKNKNMDDSSHNQRKMESPNSYQSIFSSSRQLRSSQDNLKNRQEQDNIKIQQQAGETKDNDNDQIEYDQQQTSNLENKQIAGHYNSEDDFPSDLFDSISVNDQKLYDLISNIPLQNKSLEQVLDENQDYILHLIRNCLCYRCRCGSCKCKFILDSRGGQKFKYNINNCSYYQKEFSKKQDETKLDFSQLPKATDTTFTKQNALEFMTVNKKDFVDTGTIYSKKQRKDFQQDDKPFLNLTSYKSCFQNWDTNQLVLFGPSRLNHTIKELPFFSQTTYSSSFKDQQDVPNDELTIKLKTKQLGPFNQGSFLGYSQKQKDYQQYLVQPNKQFGTQSIKQLNYQPSISYQAQFNTTFQKDFGSKYDLKCKDFKSVPFNILKQKILNVYNQKTQKIQK